MGQLSGGQKQRLALALALVSDPELFFLDEPTTGLDPQSRRQLWELMATFRTSGRTVLITTHYMEEAEQLCDRVAIVDHGKVIAQGTPNELIATLGAQYVVEFGVADGASVSESELSSLGGVVAVRHEEGHWRLQVAELHMEVEVKDHGVAFSAYFTDPWGNPLEVTTYEDRKVREGLGQPPNQPTS